MDKDTQQKMGQYLTTEHSNLQGARSGALAEASSQTSSFLSIVSAGMVALALVAQITKLGGTFFEFSLVLFTIIIYLGLSTFTRLIRLSIVEVNYILAMNRIRQFYVQSAPEMEHFLTLSSHDDARGIDTSLISIFNYRWIVYSSNAGQVAVINGFLCAVFGALISFNFLRLLPGVAVVVGFGVFILLMIGQIRFGLTTDLKMRDQNIVRFPTPPDSPPV